MLFWKTASCIMISEPVNIRADVGSILARIWATQPMVTYVPQRSSRLPCFLSNDSSTGLKPEAGETLALLFISSAKDMLGTDVQVSQRSEERRVGKECRS